MQVANAARSATKSGLGAKDALAMASSALGPRLRTSLTAVEVPGRGRVSKVYVELQAA